MLFYEYLFSQAQTLGAERKVTPKALASKVKKTLIKPVSSASPLKDFLANSNKGRKVEPDIIMLCSLKKPNTEGLAKSKQSTKRLPDLKKKAVTNLKSGNLRKTISSASKMKKSPSKKIAKSEHPSSAKRKLPHDQPKASPKKVICLFKLKGDCSLNACFRIYFFSSENEANDTVRHVF